MKKKKKVLQMLYQQEHDIFPYHKLNDFIC